MARDFPHVRFDGLDIGAYVSALALSSSLIHAIDTHIL